MPEESDLGAARAALEEILEHLPAETRLRIERMTEQLADAPLRKRTDSTVVAALTRERIAATRTLSPDVAEAIDAVLVARSLESATAPERAPLIRAWLPYLKAVIDGVYAPNPAVYDPRMERSALLGPLFASMRAYFRVGLYWCERAGIPRRWIVQAPGRQRIRLAQYVGIRLRGFKPIWQTHLPKQPEGVHLTEHEFVSSHLEIARALRRQPGIRGIASSSWYYDPEIADVSPHLGFIRELLETNGCFVFEIPCDEAMSESALYASRARQRAHAEGRYRPRAFARLWSRDALLRWAERQPGWQLEIAISA